MDTRYVVEIDLRRKGDFGVIEVGKAARHVESFERNIKSADLSARHFWERFKAPVGGVMNAMDSVASKLTSFAVYGAFGAIATASAAATYGVTQLNASLEATEISLGTIFSAQGMTDGLQSGLKLARESVSEMRQLAAKLPGEFSDLMEIMSTTSVPAFQAGMSVREHRELSANLMAAGAVSGLPMDMVAREAAQLIEGRSGAHNVLGMRLMGLGGDSAEAFNKLSSEERLGKLNAALDKYAGSIDVFAESWEGLSSTLIDNAKELLRQSTKPLFAHAKEGLASINNWIEANELDLKMWVLEVQVGIESAFTYGKELIQEWGPPMLEFAQNLGAGLKSAFEGLRPTLEMLGDFSKRLMQDPETVDKLITLGKLYLGLKAVGVALDIAGGAADAFGTGRDIFLGRGRRKRGRGGVPAGMGGMGVEKKPGFLGGIADTFATGGLLGVLAKPLATAGQAAATALATPLGMLAVAAGGAGVAFNVFEDDAKEAAKKRIDAFSSLSEAEKSVWERTSLVMRNFERTGGLLIDNGIHPMVAAFQLAVVEAEWFSLQLRQASENITGANMIADVQSVASQTMNDYSLAIAKNHLAGVTGAVTSLADLQAQQAAERRKHGPIAHRGAGTNIQKVEIVVTSNAEPSRIARLVKDELIRASRTSTSSAYARNFSASRV